MSLNKGTKLNQSNFYFFAKTSALIYTHSCIIFCPRSVVSNVLDCDIVVSEFELQWHPYVHFWTNTLVKGMTPLISQAMG